MRELEFFKSHFYKDSKRIHLNNAGLSPISMAARKRVEYWAQKFFEDGFYSDAEYMNEVAQTRKSLSQLIGCEPDEIAFFQNAGSALSQVAFGLDLKQDDEILLLDQEYSSNLYPWVEAAKRKGANHRFIESEKDLSIDPQKFLSQITARTRVITISWIQFQTGANIDIKKFVEAVRSTPHGEKIFIVVDVMQGLGVIPMSMKDWGVDAAAGGSHKWLTSPVGVGFLALKKEKLSDLKPIVVGSATYGTCDDPSDLECSPKMDVSRFESGSKQVLEITALGASCELILKTGVPVINTEALRLAKILQEGLKALGYTLHTPSKNFVPTPMVNFSDTSKDFLKSTRLKLDRAQINYAVRGPGIRLSPHAFNTEEQMNQVLKILTI